MEREEKNIYEKGERKKCNICLREDAYNVSYITRHPYECPASGGIVVVARILGGTNASH
jgi:hypothetical protein